MNTSPSIPSDNSFVSPIISSSNTSNISNNSNINIDIDNDIDIDIDIDNDIDNDNNNNNNNISNTTYKLKSIPHNHIYTHKPSNHYSNIHNTNTNFNTNSNINTTHTINNNRKPRKNHIINNLDLSLRRDDNRLKYELLKESNKIHNHLINSLFNDEDYYADYEEEGDEGEGDDDELQNELLELEKLQKLQDLQDLKDLEILLNLNDLQI